MTFSEETISGSDSVVSLQELFPSYTRQLIKPFERMLDPDIHKGMYLDFELCDREQKHKLNPILRIAQLEDAEEIVGIYKELYNGTYPYKEMENVEEVRKMIRDPSIEWIIYQDPSYHIAGCITFILNFEYKRGYIRGFMLKKAYQGYLDITKAMIGSMLGMIYKYTNKIYVWYVENRTAHAKSQYSMWTCGIAPIGFNPNKDIFMGKVESDLMQVLYDERALIEKRDNTVPHILPEVEKCFLYADRRYHLGEYKLKDPIIALNCRKISYLRKSMKKTVTKDKFGYEQIIFSFPHTDSFFQFVYTPQVKNFEKTKYQAQDLEELYVFLKEFINLGKELKIQYCEAFISAYNLFHQKLFSNVGLSPRGYVPSWTYNSKTDSFEDNILFNWFEGKISQDIQLIDQGKQLLEVLELRKSEIVGDILEESRLIDKVPVSYMFREKLSKVWNYPKMIKSLLMTGLILYLAMMVISIIIAHSNGFHIISHSISQLGTTFITPMPFMFNGSCIIGGVTTILLYCYLSRRIMRRRNGLSERLSRFGVIVGTIGSFGIMFVGIFSLDRSGPFGILHVISTMCAFGGFILALFVYGIMMYRTNLKIGKILGINDIVPLIILVVNLTFPTPLMEWILLFTILTSLIPLFCWVSFK
ncbi:MAG: DUF998 domain-containing protein [Candidatus Odinarchaeota archaeon]